MEDAAYFLSKHKIFAKNIETHFRTSTRNIRPMLRILPEEKLPTGGNVGGRNCQRETLPKEEFDKFKEIFQSDFEQLEPFFVYVKILWESDLEGDLKELSVKK